MFIPLKFWLNEGIKGGFKLTLFNKLGCCRGLLIRGVAWLVFKGLDIKPWLKLFINGLKNWFDPPFKLEINGLFI